MYELYFPLAVNQPFDKRKDKITPGIYLGMHPINVRTLALIVRLSTGMVSPQFHVAFAYFATINGRDVNLVPPRYWQAMCEFIKGKKPLFVRSD